MRKTDRKSILLFNLNFSSITFCLVRLVVGILPLNSCLEPYDPEIKEYQNLLVVDAMISDEKIPYSVILSRSFPFDKNLIIPETNALVSITDELGGNFIFSESSPGKYLSDSAVWKGRIGGIYTLHITTADGIEYKSTPQVLLKTPDIDSVYFHFLSKPGKDPGTEIDGAQVYVDTHDPDNKTWFYRWEWKETWKFKTPYINEKMISRSICWKNENSTNIVLGQSDNLTRDVIQKMPLMFISDETDRLSIRYSVEIKQFALSREVFKYWQQIENINENQGSIFDVIPSGVIGNLQCVSDPGRIVLGVFQASSVTSYRIFIDRSILPNRFYPQSAYDYCKMLSVSTMEDAEEYFENGWTILNDRTEGGVRIILLSNSISCYDCTLRGYNKIPDFWIEKE